MEIKEIEVVNPKSYNLILGQSHFIKTVEDLYEALIESAPQIKFGLAFAEASGPRLVRISGTSRECQNLAAENIKKIGVGHTFLIFLENAYPINVISAIKSVSEVVSIYAATANKLTVIVAEGSQGRGVLGVIDGEGPLGIETPNDEKKRKEFLRTIGYKL